MAALAGPAAPSTLAGTSNSELYNFPPFFTLQPVQETRQKQLELWAKVIQDWARETNTWAVVPSRLPLWENTTVQRKLSSEGQAAVVAQLLAQGHGAWEDPEDATAFAANPVDTVAATAGRLRLSWRSPAEVAAELWEQARSMGMFGQVFTVFELHSGDLAEGTPFHRMDPWLLREAIGRLQDQGKAAIFPGSTIDEEGVKFSSD